MTNFVKKALFVSCILCFTFLTTFSASYANVNATVAVERVFMTPGQGGTNSSGVYVVLKNTTGSTIAGANPAWNNNISRGFYLYKPLGNPGMAILLTALSNKTKVVTNIASTAAAGSLIMTVGATQLSQ